MEMIERMIKRGSGFYKMFFAMTIALAGQNLITFSVNLADNIMLGAYSETALSGAALVNQIQFFLQMLVGGVSEGVVVLAAQYWGRRETVPIRKIAALGLWFGAAIGVVMFLLSILMPYPLLRLLTPDEAVLAEGVAYLRIISFTYLLFCLTNVLLASLRSVQIVRVGILTSLASLLVNVVLNYILIFGKLGAPELGIRGAAIATLVARVVELLIVILYMKIKENPLQLGFSHIKKPDFTYLKDFLRVATPLFLANGVWGLNQFVQTAILGRMGGASIAANSIASAVFSILAVVCYGCATSAGVITGKAVGEGDVGKVREYAKTMQVLFLAVGIVTGVVMFLSRDLILSFYTISGEARELSRQFLGVLSVTVVGTSYQVAVLTGIVRGGGDTKFVLYNDTIFVWCVVIPSAALAAFVFHAPPVVVFMCLKCDQILKCIVAVIKVNRNNWIRPVTRDAVTD